MPLKPSFGRQWPLSSLCILAERGRRESFNIRNVHSSNGLIGKCPTLIVSIHDRSEKKHPGHLGGTMGAAVGCAARGRRRRQHGEYCTHHWGSNLHSTCFTWSEKRSTNMENWKNISHKSNSNVSMNLPLSMINIP